jgi:hypothetical protein
MLSNFYVQKMTNLDVLLNWDHQSELWLSPYTCCRLSCGVYICTLFRAAHLHLSYDILMVNSLMVDSLMVDSLMVDSLMVDSLMVDSLMVDILTF